MGDTVTNHSAFGSDMARLTFGAQLSQKLVDIECQHSGMTSLHSPTMWRKAVPELGRIDLPRHLNPITFRCPRLMQAFRIFGMLSLDLRDVPGLGHARLVSLVNTRKFDDFLIATSSAEHFTAICITEDGSGSDLHALKTTAVRMHGQYVLNGKKKFVARLRQADSYIVFAQIVATAPRLTAFLLPSTTQGLHITDIGNLGLQGVSWGSLDIENAVINESQRIGGEGQGFSLFAQHFSFWRCAMTAAAIGCAQQALNMTKKRLFSRHAFGGPIGRFTHLQQDYARHAAQLHMAWLLVHETAGRIESGKNYYTDAAMTKAEGVEVALSAVQWAMLVHGAYGYSSEIDLEKRMRDLLGIRIADGTTDVLRSQVSRGILSEQLYELALGREYNEKQLIKERTLW